MGKVLAVLRDEQFSPNSVENDRAIMMAVVERLRRQGCHVTVVSESDMSENGTTALAADSGHLTAILTMGRRPDTLRRLAALGSGVRIINPPAGVERCRRSTVEQIMRDHGVPQPTHYAADGSPLVSGASRPTCLPGGEGSSAAPCQPVKGYWLKRGDGAAQCRGDVVFAADKTALRHAIAGFRQRAITCYTVSAHVEGDVVKFYGVDGGFFRYYYPTDDGQTKFGDEQHNGAAHHYAFSATALQLTVERLAAAVGVSVYGGDCIVSSDGSFCIIDFNDWPSFSRCRAEAAEAIAALVNRVNNENNGS